MVHLVHVKNVRDFIFLGQNLALSGPCNESQVTILRKIRGNSQEFLVTNSEEPGPRNVL